MFTVIWTGYALDALADLFVAVDLATQDRLTADLDALNRRLAQDPLEEGESRDRDYRLTFAGSLAVRFRVLAADQVVRVTEIQWHGH